MSQRASPDLLTNTNAMSMSDALKVAEALLQDVSLHDAINSFRSVRSPKRRRAAAYVRSSGATASAESNAITSFADQAHADVVVYFFDRPGELGGLSIIAERRSDFDVLLVDAGERQTLEHNEAFMRAVSGGEVVWVAAAKSGVALET